jgi:hypothetical protein
MLAKMEVTCLLLSPLLLAKHLGTLLSMLATAKEIYHCEMGNHVAEVQKYGSTYFGSTRRHFTSARFVGKRIGIIRRVDCIDVVISQVVVGNSVEGFLIFQVRVKI